jgi:hypothetical protein
MATARSTAPRAAPTPISTPRFVLEALEVPEPVPVETGPGTVEPVAVALVATFEYGPMDFGIWKPRLSLQQVLFSPPQHQDPSLQAVKNDSPVGFPPFYI